MSALGFVAAAAQLGLSAIQVRPKRAMENFTAYVVLEEVHHDVLEITQHPVDVGASIADHAYSRPAELTLKAGYSDTPASAGLVQGYASVVDKTLQGVQSLVTGNNVSQVRDIYAKMLELRNKRIPFDVYTGKRAYKNMMLRALTVTTDRNTEGVLMFTAELQEVLRATTRLTQFGTAQASDQTNPRDTQPVVGQGLKGLIAAPNFNTASLPPIAAKMFTKG